MLQFGTKITQPGDGLQKITIERLYQGISKPKAILRDKIEQLRIIKEVDEKQYRQLKKYLPYFVCGIFHPAIRRTEHFAAIEYFVLDLDHLVEAELDRQGLMKIIGNLPEVVLAFISPSGDGVKIMLRLSEKCTDAALFSAFYKIFSHQFAERHGLTQVIDYRTSDVTRACFISYDAEAYFNPEASVINLQSYVKGLNFDQAESDIKAAQQFIDQQQITQQKKDSISLDEDILQQIKSKLNPNARTRKEKQYTESPQVEQVIPILADQLATYNIQLIETQKISYGKKLKLSANKMWAEINVFYGKKGWSVVKTTKSGSHPELAELGALAIKEILASYNSNQE
ncbi:MAG: CRISPR-associated primase-polymerase type B, partial [Saprospiraceae bacterium]|nr:CRISPR-associated primase-polymerase type B [Saprospiraceae bacterium]